MQPTYLPWMGYFDLMDQVDIFVILDNVQFVKQSWHQRNRIKTPKGLDWLTVPIVFRGRFGQLIKDVEIREADFWRKHLRAIQLNYARTTYFQDFLGSLLSTFEAEGPWNRLSDLNINLIVWLRDVLGIKTPLVIASNLGVEGKRSELVAAICRNLGADEYLSPSGAADYLLEEIKEFNNRNISVLFHNYEHPTYRQKFPPFLPFASAIDLIFNEGMKSIEIIRSGRRLVCLPEEVTTRRLGTIPS